MPLERRLKSRTISPKVDKVAPFARTRLTTDSHHAVRDDDDDDDDDDGADDARDATDDATDDDDPRRERQRCPSAVVVINLIGDRSTPSTARTRVRRVCMRHGRCRYSFAVVCRIERARG